MNAADVKQICNLKKKNVFYVTLSGKTVIYQFMAGIKPNCQYFSIKCIQMTAAIRWEMLLTHFQYI